MKTLPSKTTTIPDVWIVLGKFKVLIVSDLYQGFFQNHLHPSSRQWLAIMSPFGGLRIFLRSVQGLLNQTEELDELLSKVLAQELKEDLVARIADDIIVGGENEDEAIHNWERILSKLNNNNLKLSSSKTIMFPSSVDILGWVWKKGGFLIPSPHRQLALATTPEPSTVGDLRSWIGLYKTFMICTPGMSPLLEPFSQETANRDTKETIQWSSESSIAFARGGSSKALATSMTPNPSDC